MTVIHSKMCGRNFNCGKGYRMCLNVGPWYNHSCVPSICPSELMVIKPSGADSITQVRTWVYLNFSTIKAYFLCRKRSINWEHEAPLCVRILMACMTLHTTCLIRPSMGQSTWTTHFIYLHGPDSLSPIIAGILAAGIAIQIQPHLTEAFNLVPILPYTQRIYPLVRD